MNRKGKAPQVSKGQRVATTLLVIELIKENIKKKKEKKGAAGAKVAALLLGKVGKSL